MAKINLLNNKNTRKSPTNGLFVIATQQNETMFYVHSYDASHMSDSVVWTSSQNQALKFHTDSGVNKFISTHLKHRTNISVELI